MNPRKKRNWIEKEINVEIRIETGTAKRGKYTFPKRAVLVMKVSEVFVRQVEK